MAHPSTETDTELERWLVEEGSTMEVLLERPTEEPDPAERASLTTAVLLSTGATALGLGIAAAVLLL